jgi:hypothetical protein
MSIYRDQINEDEMGRACRTHGEMRDAYRILDGKLKEREHSEDLGVDGGSMVLRNVGILPHHCMASQLSRL